MTQSGIPEKEEMALRCGTKRINSSNVNWIFKERWGFNK